MKKILLIIILIPGILRSQPKDKQILIYNLAFGAVIGGVTELISNPRHVKPLKAFIHGICMGTVGGAFNYAGKSLSGNVIQKGKYGYVLPSRLVSSFGNSIIYNAGHSRNAYFQFFNFDYGFIQVSADIIEKKLRPKFLPGAFAGTIVSFNEGGRFDLKHSVLMGASCFYKFDSNIHNCGYTYQTSITVNSNPKISPANVDNTRSHEFIHVLQCMEYNNISNVLMGWNKSFRDNKRVWKWISPDLPYNDLAYILNSAFIPKYKYSQNYFEVEAVRLSKQTSTPKKR